MVSFYWTGTVRKSRYMPLLLRMRDPQFGSRALARSCSAVAGWPWPAARHPPSRSLAPAPPQDRNWDGKARGWRQGDRLPISVVGKTGKLIYCLLKRSWMGRTPYHPLFLGSASEQHPLWPPELPVPPALTGLSLTTIVFFFFYLTHFARSQTRFPVTTQHCWGALLVRRLEPAGTGCVRHEAAQLLLTEPLLPAPGHPRPAQLSSPSKGS